MEHWKKIPGVTESLPRIESWFAAQPGQRLLCAEQELIDEELANLFGYQLLQLSISRDICLFGESRVQSNFRCHPLPHEPGQWPLDLQCSFDELPFADASLDAVIVHHAQEFVANPHRLLRELQRVVIPHGQVLMLGFNPWSLLGAYGRMAGMATGSIWHHHYLSTRRLIDWLNLLGFQVDTIRYTFHRPPTRHTWLFDRVNINRAHWWTLWPLGGIYLIKAVRQVAGMTPSKPRWADKKRRFPSLVPVKPSAGSIQHKQRDKH